VLGANGILRGHLVSSQMFFHYSADRGKAEAVFAHVLEEVNHARCVERRGQWWRNPGSLELRHDGVGGRSRAARLEDLFRKPSEIFDEGQPQDAWPGPELTDCQRRHRLIAIQEAQQLRSVQPAVAVPDELQRHGVDAGEASELARGQSGQLAIVLARQILADAEDFRRHEMEVIEEPLGRWRDKLSLMNIVCQRAICFVQHAHVVVETREDAPPCPPPGRWSDGEPRGQRLRTLLQPLDAQQLIAQWFFGRRRALFEQQDEGVFHRSVRKECRRARPSYDFVTTTEKNPLLSLQSLSFTPSIRRPSAGMTIGCVLMRFSRES